MTNKFKFGDKVIYQACLYVVTAVVDDECFLISEGSYDAGIWADASKLTPATDWVKCSERMPEFGQSVTVYDGDRMWTDTTYDFGDGLCFYYDDDGRATHWMPLPAPPVEVER